MKLSTKMFIFAAGAAFGSAVSWFYAKGYWERAANEEIESMKEWLARRVEEQTPDEDQTPDPSTNQVAPSDKPNLRDYAAVLKNSKYVNDDEPKKCEVEDFVEDHIYIIRPDIFGEEDDYEEVSLTYYADGVLTDEQDNPIEDVDGMVGPDFAGYFGYYEDDAVYVRNEYLKIDFEILADLRNYSDLRKNKPHPTEGE